MKEKELAYLNGVFVPLAEARISIEDRGFQFGDGVYEVIAVYNGRPFLAEQHLARLKRSAAAIELGFDLDAHPLMPIIQEGLRRSGLNSALVYIQITRGTAPRSHEIPTGIHPTLVMTFKPLPALPEDRRRQGVRAMTTLDTRWANCYVKAITLLPNVLAKNEAIRRGYDDAIFVTATGEVRECTSANVFVVHGSRIATPSRTEAVLHGITQDFVFECAAAINLDVEERTIHVDSLRKADEVFMSSTTVEVLAITTIDDRAVSSGRVGPVTQRICDEFRTRARELRGDSTVSRQMSS